MNWIELAKEKPPIVDMGQTEHILVAYYPAPDSELEVSIGFFDTHGAGSSWFEGGTFNRLPAPRYWMPLPKNPEASR